MGRQRYTPIESLEARQLFSIQLGGSHILSLIGNSSQPNTIVVGLAPGGLSVTATVSYPTKAGVRTQSATYPISKIKQVSIVGGNKNDVIDVDQSNGSFAIKATIITHNGNDIVSAGDESDYIKLGNGTDIVTSGNGNDTMFAGTHADTLTGGSGNDVFHGGRGHDNLVAGSGANTMIDPFGHDTLMAGSGHDTFILKNIRLDPDNNYDPSKDKLKKYVPPSTSSDNSLGDTILNSIFNPLSLL